MGPVCARRELGAGGGAGHFLPLHRAGRIEAESHCEGGSWGPWWGGDTAGPALASATLVGPGFPGGHSTGSPACSRAVCLAGAAGRSFPAWLSWLGPAAWLGAWQVVSLLELGCAALFPSFSHVQPFVSLWCERGWPAHGKGGTPMISGLGGSQQSYLLCLWPRHSGSYAAGVISYVCI